MKRRKKTTLPRVTLMAFNRKDLLAFCEAVEALRLLVDDLRTEQRALIDYVRATRGKSPRKKNESLPAGTSQQPPTGGPTGG